MIPDGLESPRRSGLRRLARRLWADRSFRVAGLVFLAARIGFTLWAFVVLALRPVPTAPDEVLRPYAGEPILVEGWAGRLLGPWQRHDTLRYVRIARQGYAADEDSVFPPLYPLAIAALGSGADLLLERGPAHLLAAILVSNAAFLAALVLLHRLAWDEFGAPAATRTVVYLALFPTGFFLIAAYSESVFLLLVLLALAAGKRGRWRFAGPAGLLAALTRLTGWVLAVPLAYEAWRQRRVAGRLGLAEAVAIVLPPIGMLAFLVGRSLAGLPPLAATYRVYWHQSTGFPGADVWTAVRAIATGNAAFSLYFDLFCAFLLIVTTAVALRRLPATYGLYAAMMLLFMFLPRSELKPLYSFSRYTLMFFPTFMLLGAAGINRLILYPSLALALYFSAQFFWWGWVA
jgi:hypothetical protein